MIALAVIVFMILVRLELDNYFTMQFGAER